MNSEAAVGAPKTESLVFDLHLAPTSEESSSPAKGSFADFTARAGHTRHSDALAKLGSSVGLAAPSQATVLKVVSAKLDIEAVFGKPGGSAAYYAARRELFEPEKIGNKKGVNRARSNNRATDKIAAVWAEAVQHFRCAGAAANGERNGSSDVAEGLLLCGRERPTFVDLCGGPGGWSLSVLDGCLERAESSPAAGPPAWRGFGFSLRMGTAKSCQWYPHLTRRASEFAAVFGPTNTGDILVEPNVDALIAAARCTCGPGVQAAGRQDGCNCGNAAANDDDTRGALLVMADGGMGVPSCEATGENMDALQELYTQPLMVAEFRAGLDCLRVHGAFVCKLYDTWSATSMASLSVIASCFQRAVCIKTAESRASNSEKYLVCAGFSGRSKCGPQLDLLRAIHRRCCARQHQFSCTDPVFASDEELSALLSDSLGAEGAERALQGDAARAVAAMNEQLAQLQADSTTLLVRRAEELVAAGGAGGDRAPKRARQE